MMLMNLNDDDSVDAVDSNSLRHAHEIIPAQITNTLVKGCFIISALIFNNFDLNLEIKILFYI